MRARCVVPDGLGVLPDLLVLVFLASAKSLPMPAALPGPSAAPARGAVEVLATTRRKRGRLRSPLVTLGTHGVTLGLVMSLRQLGSV